MRSALSPLCFIFRSTHQTTIPDAYSHWWPPPCETPTPIPYLLASVGKCSSIELLPAQFALHFLGHKFACISEGLLLPRSNRGLQPSITTSSTCIPGDLQSPGITCTLPQTIKDNQLCLHPWKPAATRDNLSFIHNPRDLLKSGTTSSICIPNGLVSSGTTHPANTRDNEMAKGRHRNTINKNQCNMQPPEPSYLTTEQVLNIFL